MTRRSRRELEEAVDRLTPQVDDDDVIPTPPLSKAGKNALAVAFDPEKKTPPAVEEQLLETYGIGGVEQRDLP